MGLIGKGSWLVVGIALIILGALLRSDVFEWLLDAAGFILIILGVIAAIVGLVGLFTGSRGRSGEY